METINPNDFSDIDFSNIEYITLKNGSMILLDLTAPEKQNKSKKIQNISSSISSKNNSFKISEEINISYKPTFLKNNNNNESNKIVKNDIIFYKSKNLIKNELNPNNYNKKNNKNDLNEFRKQIDEIDKIIIDAFIERMNIIKNISKYKKEKNIPIYDPLREKELLKKRIEMCNDITFNKDIENLFKLILKISKEHQNIYIKDDTDCESKPYIKENKFKSMNDLNLNEINNKNNKAIINISNNEYNNKHIDKESMIYLISGNSENSNNLNNIANNIINNIDNNLDNNLDNNNISHRRYKRYRTFEERKNNYINSKKNKIKKCRNKNFINLACSLNIYPEIPKEINLIKKFNCLVDKLNDHKFKSYEENKKNEDKEKINKKYEKYLNLFNSNINNIDIKNNNLFSSININKDIELNNKEKKVIRRNIFRLGDNYKNEYNSFNTKKKNKIIFNKTRIYEIKKNIDETKMKFSCELNDNNIKTINKNNEYNNDLMSISNSSRFYTFRRNKSSIVFPSNNLYH